MEYDWPAEDWVKTRVPGGAWMTVEVVVGPGGTVGGTTDPGGATPVPEEPVPALGVVEDEEEDVPERWLAPEEDPVAPPEGLPGDELRAAGCEFLVEAARADAVAAPPARRIRAARATQEATRPVTSRA